MLVDIELAWFLVEQTEGNAMMGRQTGNQQSLFYDFCLEEHVPQDHLLRRIAAALDLSGVRQQLAPYCSTMGRPSLDPELIIRMLLVGYLYDIRSERRLCEEVHLNLAYFAGSAGLAWDQDRFLVLQLAHRPIRVRRVVASANSPTLPAVRPW